MLRSPQKFKIQHTQMIFSFGNFQCSTASKFATQFKNVSRSLNIFGIDWKFTHPLIFEFQNLWFSCWARGSTEKIILTAWDRIKNMRILHAKDRLGKFYVTCMKKCNHKVHLLL